MGGSFTYMPPYDYSSFFYSEGSSIYQIQGLYAGGPFAPATANISPPPSPYSISAMLVRGPSGRYQLMVPAVAGNVAKLQLVWLQWDYYDDYPLGETDQDLLLNQLTNGLYTIPDSDALAGASDVLYVRGVGADGRQGTPIFAGVLTGDAPCFIDGRRALKQNLMFQLRAATLSQTCPVWDPAVPAGFNWGAVLPSDTNYVESSFLHPQVDYKFPGRVLFVHCAR